MILPLRVSLELIAVKVDLAQFSRAVPLGLIVEVRGRRIAALSACRHGPGPHAVAELDHGDEAVAAGAIPLLRARVRARRERGQRSPLRGGEAKGESPPRNVGAVGGGGGGGVGGVDPPPAASPPSQSGGGAGRTPPRAI